MKPFDLERALAGDPIVTRDGRKVTQFVQFNARVSFPCRAVVDGDGITCYRVDGTFVEDGEESRYDLFMAPKKTQLWCNFYKGNPVPFVYGSYTSKEQAQIAAKKVAFCADFLQTIMVEVEE